MMNKIVDFVLYSEGKSGTKVTSGEFFRKSFRLDPQRITGLDYFKQEARQVKFQIPDNTWLINNLCNIGMPENNCIGDTEFWKYVCRFKNDAGIVEFIGYIKRENYYYDKKHGIISFRAIDTLGYILEVGRIKHTFTSGINDIKDLLYTTLRAIRDEKVNDMNIDIAQNYTLNGLLLSNFHLQYGTHLIDEEEINLDSAFTGDGGGWYGSGEDPPSEECEGGVKWRHIRAEDGKIVIYMVDYSYELKEYQTHLYLFESIKTLRVNTDRGLCISNVYFKSLEDEIYWHEEPHPMYDTYYTDLGYPESDNASADDPHGNNYELINSQIIFNGTALFENISLNEDEEDSGELELEYNAIVNLCLLMSNLALKIELNGDLLIINKDDHVEGETVNIADADIFDPVQTAISKKAPDYLNILRPIANKIAISNALIAYFAKLFLTLRLQYQLDIENNYSLQICQELTIYGINYRIVELNPDLDENYFKVKAWNN